MITAVCISINVMPVEPFNFLHLLLFDCNWFMILFSWWKNKQTNQPSITMFLWHQLEQLVRHWKKSPPYIEQDLPWESRVKVAYMETPDTGRLLQPNYRRPWFSFKPKLCNYTLIFKPPLFPAVTQFFFQMSFPSTLKPTDQLEQKQINLNGKAVTILFIYQ